MLIQKRTPPFENMSECPFEEKHRANRNRFRYCKYRFILGRLLWYSYSNSTVRLSIRYGEIRIPLNNLKDQIPLKLKLCDYSSALIWKDILVCEKFETLEIRRLDDSPIGERLTCFRLDPFSWVEPASVVFRSFTDLSAFYHLSKAVSNLLCILDQGKFPFSTVFQHSDAVGCALQARTRCLQNSVAPPTAHNRFGLLYTFVEDRSARQSHYAI